MQARAMRREFSFQGIKLGDPDSKMTVEDVRGVLSLQYPEIATAAITGPSPGRQTEPPPLFSGQSRKTSDSTFRSDRQTGLIHNAQAG